MLCAYHINLKKTVCTNVLIGSVQFSVCKFQTRDEADVNSLFNLSITIVVIANFLPPSLIKTQFLLMSGKLSYFQQNFSLTFQFKFLSVRQNFYLFQLRYVDRQQTVHLTI